MKAITVTAVDFHPNRRPLVTPVIAFSRSGSVGDNVKGPVVIVPTFTVTINPMEDDEESDNDFRAFS